MRSPVLAALILAPTAAVLLGSAGPAPRQTPASAVPERQCFWPQQVQNFRAGPAQTVYLRIGQKKVYELQAAGACNDLDTAFQLAIQPEVGSNRLCAGDWATVVVPGSARPLEACRVQISKVLSDEEVAALPSRYRP